MAKAFPAGIGILALGGAVLTLTGCSVSGNSAGSPASGFSAACQPFDPDATHSCVIRSERWSEIAELPEPPGMYRYCAWPGLLSGAYRTRYRDLEGKIHDFTQAPAQTPSFLLAALKGTATMVVDYRMVPRSQPCPNTPP